MKNIKLFVGLWIINSGIFFFFFFVSAFSDCVFAFASLVGVPSVIAVNTIEVFISKDLIKLYINHNEFFSVNNVLRKYNENKK